MKVIHVNLASSLSGGEYQTLALMAGLRDSGVEQCLVHRSKSRVGALARLQGLHSLTARRALVSMRADCWNQPLVLHAHDGRAVHWSKISAVLHAAPYLITRRTHTIPSDKRWTHRAYSDASRVVCVSNAVANGLQGYDAALNSCVVHDGVVGFDSNAEHAERLRETHAGQMIIAQVGRLAVEKEVGLTLEVARRLAVENSPLHFWILGDGPLRDDLRAAAEDLDNVTFFGHRNDIGDFLAAADVLLHPASFEALGSVIVEAMQHGVAVVASRIGGIPEVVVENQTGILLESGDVDGFYAALVELNDKPELRTRMAKEGRSRARSFSLEVMTESYLEIYRQCLSERSGTQP